MSNKDIENYKKLDKEDAEVVGTEIAIIDDLSIRNKIYEIRGTKVMLDFELAEIYGYTTKAFNQQVKRNIDKFPEDFRFQITREELDILVRSQIVTSREDTFFKGQIGGVRYLPWCFNESEISPFMLDFSKPADRHEYLILNGEPAKADETYAKCTYADGTYAGG